MEGAKLKVFLKVRIFMICSLVLFLALVAPSNGVLSKGASERKGGEGDPYYLFQGRGRAHGVGMCMDGVYYMAKAGANYHQILNYYYTSITFSYTDDTRPIRVKGRDGQIRTMTLHDYLYHLEEEPDDSPMEELKALYVAARTYALSCIARGKHAKEGFDVCSSGNCCQAFDENKDLSKYPNNCAANDATRGEIMTYNGQPIIAAYHGSCGGHTENNEDVWGGTPLPYLRGRVCEYCWHSPRYAWSYGFHRSELEAILNASSDTQIGNLYAIDLSSRTPGGRVKTARLIGSLGTKSVSGGVLASRLGFPSTLFDILSSNFDEYILVYNPNDKPAIVTFTFMQPDGNNSNEIVEVGPNSRFSLKVNDYVQFSEVSTRVVADEPIVAERAMYFNYHGTNDGSASVGLPQPAQRWYFAEGYTAESFDTFILIENPNDEIAQVKCTFMLPGGKTIEQSASVGACSRTTIAVDQIPGLSSTEVSTLVESTNGVGIVADRSVYFDRSGIGGGHCAQGVQAPSSEWYLAEGYTGGKFDTYILVQNPSEEKASVEATFMKEGGENIKKSYNIPAHSRFTIWCDAIQGLEDAQFSTRLVSKNGVGIIAERAMYFDYRGRKGGSDSPGVTSPALDWYLAEGYTADDFDTWVLIQNPDSKTADIQVVFAKPDGTKVERTYKVPSHSRFTISVDSIPTLEATEVSTRVSSKNGVKVIVERAMYFDYHASRDSRSGGHSSNAVPAPSQSWYFAEGYTGF